MVPCRCTNHCLSLLPAAPARLLTAASPAASLRSIYLDGSPESPIWQAEHLEGKYSYSGHHAGLVQEGPDALKPPPSKAGTIESPTSAHAVDRASLGFVSHSYGMERKPKPWSDEFVSRYKVKKHREGASDFVYSQPRAKGDRYTLRQVQWCFDETHPAVAGEHFARTELHNTLLHEERVDAENRRLAEKAKSERAMLDRWFEGVLQRAEAKRGSVSALTKVHRARSARLANLQVRRVARMWPGLGTLLVIYSGGGCTWWRPPAMVHAGLLKDGVPLTFYGLKQVSKCVCVEEHRAG